MYSKLKPGESYRGQNIATQAEADWLLAHRLITTEQHQDATALLATQASSATAGASNPSSGGPDLGDRIMELTKGTEASGDVGAERRLTLTAPKQPIPPSTAAAFGSEKFE